MDVAPGGGVDLRAPDEHVLPARFRIRHNGWNDDDDGRDVLTACVHQQALPSDRPLDHCDLRLGERGFRAFPSLPDRHSEWIVSPETSLDSKLKHDAII